MAEAKAALRKMHVVIHTFVPARLLWNELAAWQASYFGLAVDVHGTGVGATRSMSDENGGIPPREQ